MKRSTLAAVLLCTCLAAVPALALAGDDGHGISYNDSRFAGAVDFVMQYVEGSIGATLMAVAGVATVICAAFGQWRLTLSLLILFVGALSLRTMISTFFNDVSLDHGTTVVTVKETPAAESEVVPDVYVSDDIAELFVPAGTPVLAFDNGTVKRVETVQGLGKSVVVAHDQGIETVYGHLASTTVQVGQTVSRSAALGTVGNTGLKKGSETRLRFEIHRKGEPQKFLSIYPGLNVAKDGRIEGENIFAQRLIVGPDTEEAASGEPVVAEEMESF
jgi:type IV secretory pathway VirB2 component (pilin)